jgi:hypothetical protein
LSIGTAAHQYVLVTARGAELRAIADGSLLASVAFGG